VPKNGHLIVYCAKQNEFNNQTYSNDAGIGQMEGLTSNVELTVGNSCFNHQTRAHTLVLPLSIFIHDFGQNFNGTSKNFCVHSLFLFVDPQNSFWMISDFPFTHQEWPKFIESRTCI